ncbi:hypothetical protein C8R44DRAFT_743149 [Mycena epipterygia]|nr:hypothetical protein C8R44DRAFT_743149 [Mycena epipterygia]
MPFLSKFVCESCLKLMGNWAIFTSDHHIIPRILIRETREDSRRGIRSKIQAEKEKASALVQSVPNRHVGLRTAELTDAPTAPEYLGRSHSQLHYSRCSTLLKLKDVLDASRKKSIVIRFPDSNGNGATVRYTSSETALPFPSHSRGILYYRFEPHAAPLEGSVRFRITPDGTPLSFSRGQDLLAPWWQMIRPQIAYRARYVPICDQLLHLSPVHTIPPRFTVLSEFLNPNVSHGCGRHGASSPYLFVHRFATQYLQEYLQKVPPVVRLNIGRQVVHLRIVKIDNPAHVEAKFGVENIFWVVVIANISHYSGAHLRQCDPRWMTISIAISLFYRCATEFWQFEDPGLFKSPPATVRRCLGREDPTCSDSILLTGINPAHVRYFGQLLHVHSLVNVSKLFLSKEEQARSSRVWTPYPPQR